MARGSLWTVRGKEVDGFLSAKSLRMKNAGKVRKPTVNVARRYRKCLRFMAQHSIQIRFPKQIKNLN